MAVGCFIVEAHLDDDERGNQHCGAQDGDEKGADGTRQLHEADIDGSETLGLGRLELCLLLGLVLIPVELVRRVGRGGV